MLSSSFSKKCLPGINEYQQFLKSVVTHGWRKNEIVDTVKNGNQTPKRNVASNHISRRPLPSIVSLVIDEEKNYYSRHGTSYCVEGWWRVFWFRRFTFPALSVMQSNLRVDETPSGYWSSLSAWCCASYCWLCNDVGLLFCCLPGLLVPWVWQ